MYNDKRHATAGGVPVVSQVTRTYEEQFPSHKSRNVQITCSRCWTYRETNTQSLSWVAPRRSGNIILGAKVSSFAALYCTVEAWLIEQKRGAVLSQGKRAPYDTASYE